MHRRDLEGMPLRAPGLMVKFDAFLKRARQPPFLRKREPDGPVIEPHDFALEQEQSQIVGRIHRHHQRLPRRHGGTAEEHNLPPVRQPPPPNTTSPPASPPDSRN